MQFEYFLSGNIYKEVFFSKSQQKSFEIHRQHVSYFSKKHFTK